MALQDFSVSQETNPYGTTKLLLDGQQRLTSLSAVIRGEPVSVRGRRRPIDILFNLDHPDAQTYTSDIDENAEDDDEFESDDLADAQEDEMARRFNEMTFVVAAKRLAKLPQWVSVTDVFNSDSDAEHLQKAGVKDFDDPRFAKYSERLKRLRAIKRYPYTVHILGREQSYEEVTEIFVRVNSLGAKLRSSDLATAQITAKWTNSLSQFEAFAKECEGMGFPFDSGLVVRNLVALITGQSRFKTVAGIKTDTLKEFWKPSQEAMRFALNFARSNGGVDSIALLSSPFILIALASYGHENEHSISQDASNKLLRWFHLANAKGRYSRGSSETALDQDLGVIKREKSVDGLIRLLRAQVGRFDIEVDDLRGKNQRSAYFKTMFLAFREAGARDWDSNLNISIKHSGTTHKLQFHHVFPKQVLRGHYDRAAINDIANLVFIGGKTNRRISAASPERYLKKMLDDGKADLLASQCVPLEENLYSLNRYSDFLETRRALIADRLNAFITQPETEAEAV